MTKKKSETKVGTKAPEEQKAKEPSKAEKSEDSEDSTAKLSKLTTKENPRFTGGHFKVTKPLCDPSNKFIYIGDGLSLIDLPSLSDFAKVKIDANLFDSDYNYGIPLIKSTSELEAQNIKLKKEKVDLINKYQELKCTVAEQQEREEQLTKLNEEWERNSQEQKDVNSKLIEKLRLGYLLSQVNDEARNLLLESEEFQDKFTNMRDCTSYVLSIDIRRSTELMLKARRPQDFEKFITELCKKLTNVILANYGVFDKFTGDGILAFFPTFFCGPDAGLFAVKSAIECHDVFKTHYQENRSCFISILKDIGLGIGIDYGSTYLVNMNNAYTVIGTPVVYATNDFLL